MPRPTPQTTRADDIQEITNTLTYRNSIAIRQLKKIIENGIAPIKRENGSSSRTLTPADIDRAKITIQNLNEEITLEDVIDYETRCKEQSERLERLERIKKLH